MMNLSFKLTYSVVFRHLAPPFVELISQGESPASVREYVSTWVRQYVHKHFLVFVASASAAPYRYASFRTFVCPFVCSLTSTLVSTLEFVIITWKTFKIELFFYLLEIIPLKTNFKGGGRKFTEFACLTKYTMIVAFLGIFIIFLTICTMIVVFLGIFIIFLTTCTMIVAFLGIFIIFLTTCTLIVVFLGIFIIFFNYMYHDCGFPGQLHYFFLTICTMIVAFLGIFIILF